MYARANTHPPKVPLTLSLINSSFAMTTTELYSVGDYIATHDAFAAQLGAVHQEVRAGYARVCLQMTERLQNFHGSTHGGTLAALAAVVLGAAANSRGYVTVATAINLEFLAPSQAPEMLLAEAREMRNGTADSRVHFEVLIHGLNAGELLVRGSAMMKRRTSPFPPA